MRGVGVGVRDGAGVEVAATVGSSARGEVRAMTPHVTPPISATAPIAATSARRRRTRAETRRRRAPVLVLSMRFPFAVDGACGPARRVATLIV
ncbi:hypothetical protein GCM10009532_11250 [Microbacterium aurantiacum]